MRSEYLSNPLVRLGELGQAVWYDQVRRGLITGGEMARIIERGEIVGVTSNPTIFEKAIAGSPDYDAALRQHAHAANPAEEIYEALAVEDIRAVADLLRPVYERTGRRDGYVSLEVSPRLAHDPEATLAEARRLFSRIGRENAMVKIPGTPAGVRAFEDAVAEGINVNVTLLFGLKEYETVARAYVRGLERRAASGLPVEGVASVASFFVSRVDTAIDAALEEQTRAGHRELATLLGRAAIANARLAYQRFKAVFREERFLALAARGAMVQRPLWASTGTKNPRYSDVLYVEELIGPDTVNTMPLATLEAFRDHGRAEVSIERDLATAGWTLHQLGEVGIDLEAVARSLQEQGVRAFGQSFERLLAVLEDKRQALREGRVCHYSVANTEPAPAPAGVVERIWRKDGSAWTDDPVGRRQVAGALGWLHLPEQMSEQIAAFEAPAAEARREGFTDIFLLGMGGSSLAAEVLWRTFGAAPGWPRLTVLDTTHPDAIRRAAEGVDLARTLFLVSSKSGTTLETLSLFRLFFDRVRTARGEDAGQNFVALTDPGTPLENLALEHRFRRVVRTPEDVGGRYSALSPFGLLPAALIGADAQGLLDRAQTMMHACASCVPAEENPGLWLGLLLGTMASGGRDKVTFMMTPVIESFGLWVEQLLAESTGKKGRGLIPVVGEPPGPPDVYGEDRLFVALRVASAPDEGLDRRIADLEAAGQPVIRLELRDTLDLGGEFFRWEFATAVAGAFLRINAFDQPNVQESKDNTDKILAEYQQRGALPLAEWSVEQAVASLLLGARPGDYFAFTAYIPATEATDRGLGSLRSLVRDRLRLATTVGYGPRFLHSTGQLHKGGPNSGLFVQIVSTPESDLEIPGQPYSFGTLLQAQAIGDTRSLASHRRRAVRIDLGRDVGGGLARLQGVIERALAKKASR